MIKNLQFISHAFHLMKIFKLLNFCCKNLIFMVFLSEKGYYFYPKNKMIWQK